MNDITLRDIQRATIAARKRLSDSSIGTQVHQGRLQIVRVTYPDGVPQGVVTTLTGLLDPLDAVAYLNAMQGPCRVNLLSRGGLDIANGSVEIVIGDAVLTITHRMAGPINTISVYRVGSRTRAARIWATVTPEHLREAIAFAERIHEAPALQ